MIKRLCLISIFSLACGCVNLDKLISPKQQCSLLRKGSYIAVQSGLQYAKKKIDYKKYIKIIKTKVLDKLDKNSKLTRLQWESILKELDLSLGIYMKKIIRKSLYILFQYVDVPKTKDKSLSLGKRFVMYAKCIFYGVVDFLSQRLSRGEKSFKRISLLKDFNELCKMCEEQCSSCPK